MAKLNFTSGKFGGAIGDDGNPIALGKLYFYEPGTTTNKDTYTTSDLSVPNANPVILDANGRATIWLNGNYKVKLTDSADVTIYTEDNINPVASTVEGNYNLVLNPSFEDSVDGTNPDSWDISTYTGGTVARVTDAQAHGLASMKFTSTGSGGGFITTENFVPVSPLSLMAVSFKLKGTAAVRNVVDIIWYTSAQVLISTTSVYDEDTTNPTAWAPRTYYTKPPATAYYAKLRLYGCHSSDATTGDTWFDDISLVQIVPADQWQAGPPPTYVSGTQFTVEGDWTDIFEVGRRIKTTDTAGTDYSTITASAYTSLTTVTVSVDSGSLDSGLSAVSYGLVSATNTSIPGVEISEDDWTFQGDVTFEGSFYPNETTNTITGSAVSSVTFSGLDGNSVNGYELFGLIKTSANILAVTVELEGDITQSNYRLLNADAGTATSNSNQIGGTTTAAVGALMFHMYISIRNGYPLLMVDSTWNNGAVLDRYAQGITKAATITNITSLTINSSSGVSQFEPGSYFRLRQI